MKDISEDRFLKNNVLVEWVDLGEGWSGDYDPDDPDDDALLRFDVSKVINGETEEVPDASYCTRVPVETDPKIKMRGLEIIMDNVYCKVHQGTSIKKLCEWLSWISVEEIESSMKGEDHEG
jgi:hypothetical protein